MLVLEVYMRCTHIQLLTLTYTCTIVPILATHNLHTPCFLFALPLPHPLSHLLPCSRCSHLWVVCIRNILATTRNTPPDTAFPDSSTFGTYDNDEDNVPYIASEFDAAAEGITFPYMFGVGNESEPNDFPDQYRNGPVVAERSLYCFVRYFVSTEVRESKHHMQQHCIPCMHLLFAGHA